VISVFLRGSRHSATKGYVRSTYAATDVDLVAFYCAAVDRCYAIRAADFDGKTQVQLRLAPAKNNQRSGVRMAAQYTFGAVAQLEERRAGSAKVRGSSPLSSTSHETPALAGVSSL
jgi:hypothetical protein